jgi:hypothetical protein
MAKNVRDLDHNYPLWYTWLGGRRMGHSYIPTGSTLCLGVARGAATYERSVASSSRVRSRRRTLTAGFSLLAFGLNCSLDAHHVSARASPLILSADSAGDGVIPGFPPAERVSQGHLQAFARNVKIDYREVLDSECRFRETLLDSLQLKYSRACFVSPRPEAAGTLILFRRGTCCDSPDEKRKPPRRSSLPRRDAGAESTPGAASAKVSKSARVGQAADAPRFIASMTLVGALDAGDLYRAYADSPFGTSPISPALAQVAGFSTDGSGPQPTVEVRQSGKGQDSGLRSKLEGPAFATSTSGIPDSSFAFQSGMMKLNGQYLQYAYTSQKISAAGFESSTEFIGDELNRDAVEFRIARKLGNFSVNFTSMENDHFESDQTGIGNKNAQNFNQIGFDWSVDSWLLGVAMRQTTLYSGGMQRDIRAYQTASLGPLYLSNSLNMPLNDPVSRAVTDTLSLYGKNEKMDYWADATIGNGTNLNLSSFDGGIDFYAIGRWAVSAATFSSPGAWYGEVYVPSDSGVSLSFTTEAEGLRVGPEIGWEKSAGAYGLLKAWLPLGSSPRPSRWYFPGQLSRYNQELASFVGYDLGCLVGKVCR